jgi:KDO2-lipid IV(A) lauroyltransferase
MSEVYPPSLSAACSLMNHYFEQMIIDKPQQYMWSYNRYKRPHGAEIAPID